MNQPIGVKVAGRAEESQRERTRRTRSGRAWLPRESVAGVSKTSVHALGRVVVVLIDEAQQLLDLRILERMHPRPRERGEA